MPSPIGQSRAMFTGRHLPPRPVVVSITPDLGSASGGTPVTIVGAHFLTATSAAIGGVALSSFVVVDDSHITGVTGAHAEGASNVTVTSPSGTSDPLVGGFAYFFDTGTLPWSGFWMDHPVPPPAVVTWPGTASAGSSGAHPLGVVGSAVGASLNGHATADYSGPRDASAANADQFYATGGYSGKVLFNMRTAGPDPGGGAPYFGPAILAYANVALFGVGFSTLGVYAWQYDGSWTRTPPIACSLNAWHRFAWKFLGNGLRAQLDGGAWTALAPVASGWGGLSISTQQISIGNVSYGAAIDGRIACVQTANVILSDANFAKDLDWTNGTFDLSL